MTKPLDTDDIRRSLIDRDMQIDVKELIIRLTYMVDRLNAEITKRDAALLRERASNKSLRKMLRIPEEKA
jgi:hypothetical protein